MIADRTPKAITRSLTIFVASVATIVLASLCLCDASLGQAARQPEETRPEARIFRIRYVQADELLDVIHQLIPEHDGLQVAAHERTNSLIASGTQEDVRRIGELVEMLDVEEPKVSSREVKVFSLANVVPASSLENVLQVVASGKDLLIAFDDQRNSVIASGDEAELNVIEALLLRLDSMPTNERQAAEVSDGLMQLRIVWLATGVDEGKSAAPPADLDSVISELSGIGIENPRLVAQILINTTEGNRKFQAVGDALLEDVACSFQVTGSVGKTSESANDQRSLEIQLSVETNDGQSRRRICSLGTTINAPLGHSVVLGATPALEKTSLFVIQLKPRDG